MSLLENTDEIKGTLFLAPSCATAGPCNAPAPIGVFWDIENCSIPFHKSALGFVGKIRDTFFEGQREAEFMCVCDIGNQNKDTIQELNDAQVTVVHISAVSKNTSDDKLKQALRRFAADHQSPATVVLISGDVNFACDLSDLRYRHHIHVILVHRRQVSTALLSCANQCRCFEDFISDLPTSTLSQAPEVVRELLVSNLPVGPGVQSGLQRLCKSLRGKIIKIEGATALLRFPSNETTLRAQKRMDGEEMLGRRIRVQFPEQGNLVKKQGRSISSGKKQIDRRLAKTKMETLSGNVVIKEMEKLVSDGRKNVDRGEWKVEGSFAEHSTDKGVHCEGHGVSAANRKIKNRSRCKNIGLHNSYTLVQQKENTASDEDMIKKSTPVGNPLQKSLSLEFGWIQSKSSESLSSLSKPLHLNGKGELGANGMLTIKTWDGMFGSETMPNGSGWSDVSGSEKQLRSQHHQSTPFSSFVQEYDQHQKLHFCQLPFDQLYATYPTLSKRYENHESFDKSIAMMSASSPTWKCMSPDNSSVNISNESSGFRRTPGARRPISFTKTGMRNPCSLLCKKPLSSFSMDDSVSPFNTGITSKQTMFDRYLQMTGFVLHDGQDNVNNSSSTQRGVELIISNLDYNISTHEWKKILTLEFQQHVHVIAVNVQMQPDNTSIGFVKVQNVEDARYAISLFHRKKIGYKRIHVALANGDSTASTASIKAEVIGLLSEVTGSCLPLFKFIELFEKRFHCGISVSELYHMKDTVEIIEQEGAGRMVVLLSNPCDDSVECLSIKDDLENSLESPVCRIHCYKGGLPSLETIDMSNLPHVIMQLRTFSAQVHKLLQSHDGSLPIVSFPTCFAFEFDQIHAVSEGGVPLEHLITCVPGVQLSISEGGIKKVHWAENKSILPLKESNRSNCNSPVIGQQLLQLTHEVIELLKNSPQCRMPFSKFIPSYHHHFGRQCRVADYGYTKLLELFEAIPHVAQVIGGGSRRYITLTHKAQMKRFSVDLLRILKSQASKQISFLDFPIVFNKVIGKVFDITEYGLCFLEDLLCELSESSFAVINVGVEMTIALPKKDQTLDEMERTKQFALEVVDLLRHSPQCRMAFSKFIPAYHHHFAKQCRVADYGLTKLVELFEAIPNIIKIVDDQDDKYLCLTEDELLHVIEDQITALLRSFPHNQIHISEFSSSYKTMYGHGLRLDDFGVQSIDDLVRKLSAVAKIENTDGQWMVVLVDRTLIQLLARSVLLILMDLTDGSMLLEVLCECYQQIYNLKLDVKALSDLHGIVEVSTLRNGKIVKLCPLQMFARDSRTLLLRADGHLQMSQFETNYIQHFGVSLMPASYGYPTILALVQAVPHVVVVKGKGSRRTLLLSQQFQEKLANLTSALRVLGDTQPVGGSLNETKSDDPSTDSGYTDQRDDEELLGFNSHGMNGTLDLLSGPVPSSIPSPELYPRSRRPLSSLMTFDCLPCKQGKDFLLITDEEKHGLKTPLCRTPVSNLLAFAAQLLPTAVYESTMPSSAVKSPFSNTCKQTTGISSARGLCNNCREITNVLLSSCNDTGKTNDKNTIPNGTSENSVEGCLNCCNKSLTEKQEMVEDWSLIREMSKSSDNSKSPPIPSEMILWSDMKEKQGESIQNHSTPIQNCTSNDDSKYMNSSCSPAADMVENFTCELQFQSFLTENISPPVILHQTPGRKPDSTKKSRIAARFDIVPMNPSSPNCCT